MSKERFIFMCHIFLQSGKIENGKGNVKVSTGLYWETKISFPCYPFSCWSLAPVWGSSHRLQSSTNCASVLPMSCSSSQTAQAWVTSMGCSPCAPLLDPPGLEKDLCSTVVLHGLRTTWATPVPWEPLAAPSSWTPPRCLQGCFWFLSLLSLSAAMQHFCPFSNMFSQRCCHLGWGTAPYPVVAQLDLPGASSFQPSHSSSCQRLDTSTGQVRLNSPRLMDACGLGRGTTTSMLRWQISSSLMPLCWADKHTDKFINRVYYPVISCFHCACLNI